MINLIARISLFSESKSNFELNEEFTKNLRCVNLLQNLEISK